jgi:hypothetical protein
MKFASVGWDYTRYAQLPYMDQPPPSGGFLEFPDQVKYDSSAGRYELHYNSSWHLPSVETVLYVDRKDLVNAFMKQPWPY